jgi:iron complex outermembrane recepter protein
VPEKVFWGLVTDDQFQAAAAGGNRRREEGTVMAGERTTITRKFMRIPGHPRAEKRRRRVHGHTWPSGVCASLLALAALNCHAQETTLAPADNAAPGQEQSGVVELKKMSVEDLMSVEVTTVSRQESTIGRSPAAVFVITPEDIRRSGATSLPELFRMAPGMDVARIDNNKWAVSARGLNDRFNGKLLVQVDGRTVYNPLSSGVFWDAVDYPLEDIERIEVIRGPGASVWGANAVNGIINIITKSAKETQGGLISGGGGTEEPSFGTFHYGGKIGNHLYYRVYGKGFKRDKQFALSGDSHDDWWGASGGVRLEWQMSERDSVTLQGDFVKDVAQRKDFRPTVAAPFSLTNVENEATHAGNVLARWGHQRGNGSSWTLQAYWDRFERKGNNGFVDLRWDTYDVDFQHQLPLSGRQKIVYGVAYRYIDAFLGPSTGDNGFAVSFPPPHRHPQLFSAFVQDQITLVEDKFSLTLGSKVEHNDFTGFEYQPTVRLLWTPTRRQTVWAAVSRAVRTPTLSEDGIATRQTPSFPPALRGAPLFGRLRNSTDFKSEELLAYELGYRAQATDKFSVDLASFYNVYDNLRVVVPGTATPGAGPGTFDLPLNFQNRMKGETYGVELAATWQLTDWWRLYGTYTFLRMNLHRDAGLAASAEVAEGQSPQHQVYLRSSWNLPRHVEFDLIGRFVDRLPGFGPVVESYPSLDARLSWRPRRNLEFAVVGQNLLDNHHAESGTVPLLKSLLVEIQRSVYGKATWRF